MNYLDYDIAIELNGVEFTGNPASYILTIRDSIYDVFPQASLFFPDETSIFKTGGMLTDGFPIKLKLGLDGKMVSCPYVISQGETGSNMTVGFISGGMLLKLEHIGVSLMSSRTDAMKGLISDIMDDVIKNLKFDSSSIEKTRGKATWWRLGLNEEDFINKILKPSALSYNGSNTPLFFFGDCRNSFNVKSFSSMIKQKTAASYAVAPQPPSSIRSDGIETVSDIRPFTEGLRSSMMITKPRIFGYNGKNGNMVVNSDSAFKHVEGPGDAIPICAPLGDTQVIDMGRQPQSTDEKYLWQARVNNFYRDLLAQERVIISIPFNPKLYSGKTIELQTYIPDIGSGSARISDHYSGLWLIEQSAHAWVGPSKKATSQLVLSRGLSKFTDRSLMKKKAISS